MSIEQVIVNCQNCTQPGQLRVGVGRAMTVERQSAEFQETLLQTNK